MTGQRSCLCGMHSSEVFADKAYDSDYVHSEPMLPAVYFDSAKWMVFVDDYGSKLRLAGLTEGHLGCTMLRQKKFVGGSVKCQFRDRNFWKSR